MTVIYMKCNTALKRVNPFVLNACTLSLPPEIRVHWEKLVKHEIKKKILRGSNIQN